jgi:hypothetical protein
MFTWIKNVWNTHKPRSGIEIALRAAMEPAEEHTDPKLGEVPVLVRRTTYAWNWMNIPVPGANAFWHGWSDGMSGRKPDHIVNIGRYYNKDMYDFGILLGASKVNGRDAMAHLVEYYNRVAAYNERYNEG